MTPSRNWKKFQSDWNIEYERMRVLLIIRTLEFVLKSKVFLSWMLLDLSFIMLEKTLQRRKMKQSGTQLDVGRAAERPL